MRGEDFDITDFSLEFKPKDIWHKTLKVLEPAI
jgi:hypothetical protein